MSKMQKVQWLVTGIVIGEGLMYAVMKHGLDKYTKLVDSQAERKHETISYLIDKTMPHLPDKEMQEVVDYMQLNYTASCEEALELGRKLEDL